MATTTANIEVGSKVTVNVGFAAGETGEVEALYPNALGGPAVMVLLPIYGVRRYLLEHIQVATEEDSTTAADLPTRADLAIRRHHRMGRAVKALRDADATVLGWTLPLKEYVEAVKAAQKRRMYLSAH